MKKLTIILSFVFILSCNKNNKKEDSSIPEQSFLTFLPIAKKSQEFDLDTFSNFKNLLKTIESVDCIDYKPILKIKTTKKIYKIQPLIFCESIFDYKLRQIIYINTDSITVNYNSKYSIDKLKNVLYSHLENPAENQDYPKKEEERLISINVDNDKSIKDAKELLIKIINAYNDLDITNNFSFMFSDIGILPQATIDENTPITCTTEACQGNYKGPEFIKGSDVAHQLSNTMSGAVGDKLKALYKSGNYSKVDFTNIKMTTEGMGSGQVTYSLYIPFAKVKNKCEAYTSFDHVGGWNHAPALSQRKSQLQSALIAGHQLHISNLKTTKEGLQEYWIQWKNKVTQADCK